MGEIGGRYGIPKFMLSNCYVHVYVYAWITIIDVTEIEINLLTTRFCKEEEVACKLMYIYHLDIEKTVN